MNKVLILGATGMAGHVVYTYLSSLNRYEIHTVCYRKKIDDKSIIIDIYSEQALRDTIEKIRPNYVINCIGVLIKGSKESLTNCIYINAYFPHLLSKILHQTNESSKLFHISTDCVFSGKRGFYTDQDVKDALDVYGMTKNLGEIINDKDLTIRTSIIGPEIKQDGEGLFHWLYSQRDKKQVNGYTKSIWGGVTTLQLAKGIDYLIDHPVCGLYQMTNGLKISKYVLLTKINDIFELDMKINKVAGPKIDKSIKPTKIPNLTYFVPSYDEMLIELKDFMLQKKEYYSLYF